MLCWRVVAKITIMGWFYASSKVIHCWRNIMLESGCQEYYYGWFYAISKVMVCYGCLARKILVPRTARLCGRILRELAPQL